MQNTQDFHQNLKSEQEKDQSKVQQQFNQKTNQQKNLLKMLLPPNPLISKQVMSSQQYINMKLIQPYNERNLSNKRLYINHLAKSKQLSSPQQFQNKILTLFNGYNSCNLLYLKYQNTQINQRNKKKYFSSIFSPIYLRNNKKFEMTLNIPNFIGMTKKIKNPQKSLIINLQEQLQFSSNFQSGNLFAVYKTGSYEYDLILQNDFNTNGFTQWFYFEVQNKNNKNFVAKFNIVNLYKTQSLYNKGMKPVVNSLKSGKGWLRKGFNIYYDQNFLKCEQNSKYYKTLSFCYDFTKQNDIVSFSHAIPYPYSRLQKMIKVLQGSNKCIVKTLGNTPLKKPLKMVKFQTQNKNIQKKAIIIMARQHPGETQGSFLIEQIMMSFLKPSQEIQFLLWRFNFYIIPMINIDGVVLGNYRSNAMGFDLNRNWQNQSKAKHPQVYYVKSQIKKIMTKQKIQLILDLHGHSRKMNSFFYGNPFSNNTYIYPLVASKINSFIKFQECRFTLQRKEKANTARVALGNLIKQTGNVYTFEVSFYGGIKKLQQKKITFLQDHYKQLGNDLLKTMYKVYNQEYKQEKSLKQSLYLKDIRRQITGIQDIISKLQDSGSDSQAEEEMEQFTKELNQEIREKIQQKTKQFQENKKSIDNQHLSQQQSLSQLNKDVFNFNQKKSVSQFQRLNKILSRNHQSIIEESQNIKKRLVKRQIEQNVSGKNQNLSNLIKEQKKQKKPFLHAEKLKIYGETYLIKNPLQQIELQKSKDYLTLDLNNSFEKKQDNIQNSFNMRSIQNGNFSLNLKRNNLKKQQQLKSSLQFSKKQDMMMNDMYQFNISRVRINRLQYKKIKRHQKNQETLIRKQSSKKVGVFKLPSILKQYKK